MATRFYLPSAGTPPLSSLAYGSGWDKTSQATRLPMVTTKTDTPNALFPMTTTILAPEFHLAAQFQISGLAAQTITGTIKGQNRVSTNASGWVGTLAIAARIVSSDGSTLRGHLIGTTPAASTNSAIPPAFTTANINRSFRDSSDSASIALSSVTCVDGDVLIVEIGCRDNVGDTAASGTVRFTDVITNSDLPEDDTTTGSTWNPWIEFSQTINFVGGVTFVPIDKWDTVYGKTVKLHKDIFTSIFTPLYSPPVIVPYIDRWQPIINLNTKRKTERGGLNKFGGALRAEIIIIISGNKLLAPVNLGESWRDHFASRGWTTIRDQVNAGYPIFAQPVPQTGVYTEIFDYGTVLSNVIANVDFATSIVAGTVTVTCSIRYSTDKSTWSAPVVGTSLFIPSFRYLELTITFTGVN